METPNRSVRIPTRENRDHDVALGFIFSVRFIRFHNRLASPARVPQERTDLLLTRVIAEEK